MSFLKCKMCGGSMEVQPGQSVAVCEYCGTKQTMPRLDNDRKTNLYDRANHFRRSSEYDKAARIFEQILDLDPNDAEAYWSLILCRYGIEYVEDPVSRKRVPTVNRAQYTSIFADENYKAALGHADTVQREVYEQEAQVIDQIQRDILAISRQETPFDVFICYKETDAMGRRTQDSVLAHEIYRELTREGLKVFYARITLEDKIGTAYEPYIFAALQSAPVMIALTTNADHLQAAWVKNEWSRYLALIRGGVKKMLVPAYRDMDPYDLPEEFSHLQALDLARLGAMQDLVHGIKKIITRQREETVLKQEKHAEPDSGLLRRAFIFLEDGNWDQANAYLEKVLDIEPEHAMAYVGKLMADLHVQKQEQLANCPQSFADHDAYKKAVRYADPALKAELENYVSHISERNEEQRVEGIYAEGTAALEKASLKTLDNQKKISELKIAIAKFESISRYENSADQAEKAHMLLENQIKIQKKKKKRTRLIVSLAVAVLIVAAAAVVIAVKVVIPEQKYGTAETALKNGEFDIAISVFTALDDYKDAVSRIPEATYAKAESLLAAEEFDDAHELFSGLGDYKDAASKADEAVYQKCKKLLEEECYETAAEGFQKIAGYADADELSKECMYLFADQLFSEKKFRSAMELYQKLGDYKDSYEKRVSSTIRYAEILNGEWKIEEAIEILRPLQDEKAKELLQYCYYFAATEANTNGEYKTAISYLEQITDWHTDAEIILNDSMYQYLIGLNDTQWQLDENYQMAKKLKEKNYLNIAELWKQKYGWKMEAIAINDTKEDSTTMLDSVSKYSTWYFHMRLTGGEPSAMTKVSYKAVFPDGDVNTNTWGGEWGQDYTGTCWFYYNTPAYGATGQFKVYFYDGAGNQIGEETIRITG